jgi:hypothetical protein
VEQNSKASSSRRFMKQNHYCETRIESNSSKGYDTHSPSNKRIG